MADGTTAAIGLSVGATALAAVTAEHTVTRRPVLTRYDAHPPRIGTAAENPDAPDIDEPGVVFADFVDRVGDPEPVPGSDGSTQAAEGLLGETLHALAYLSTRGYPLPPAVAVAHPAHWPPEAVDGLRAGLAEIPDWSQHPVSVVSDVTAALTALQASPGLPAGGIILVCDLGGSGSSITLVDAGNGYRPIGATVRHAALSGELIDQALLNYVVDDLTASGSLNGTLAIGSLNRLRNQCRDAKEQLSTNTVTELPVDLPGYHGEVWLTRAELDGVIHGPLGGFITAVEETLQHNQVPVSDLSAVVTVGGGANAPAVTTGLGEHFGVTVISSPRPELAAAVGAALGATHAPGVPPAAAPWPPVSAAPVPAAPAAAGPPPVPSDAMSAPPGWPVDLGASPGTAAAGVIPPPPSWPAEREPFPGSRAPERASWRRGPLAVILVCAVAVLIAGVLAVVVLRHAASTGPGTMPATTETSTSQAPAPPPLAPPSLSQHPVFPEVPAIPPVPESAPEPEPEISEAPASP